MEFQRILSGRLALEGRPDGWRSGINTFFDPVKFA